jgi:hypothetical protein
MACCLSPGCCPTRRPTGGSTKRVQRVAEVAAMIPHPETPCVKLPPQSPPLTVEQVTQPPVLTKCLVADAKVAPCDACTEVTSPPVTSGDVNDFMATFFKSCEQIVRSNQATLQQALLLDDRNTRLMTSGGRPTLPNQVEFSLSLSSSLSSSLSPSTSVEQCRVHQPSRSPVSAAEAAFCDTSCRRLDYDDALTDLLGTGNSASSSGVEVLPNLQSAAAVIAPANSPVSLSPVMQSDEFHDRATDAVTMNRSSDRSTFSGSRPLTVDGTRLSGR